MEIVIKIEVYRNGAGWSYAIANRFTCARINSTIFGKHTQKGDSTLTVRTRGKLFKSRAYRRLIEFSSPKATTKANAKHMEADF